MKFSGSLLIVLSVFIAGFSLTSCDEEDSLTPNPVFDPDADPNNPQKITSNSLVGTWEMTSLTYAGSSTVSQSGQTFTTNFSAEATSMTYEITFNDNPKTYSTMGGYTVELTSFIDTNTFVQTVSIPDIEQNGTWSLNGNILALTDSATNETNSGEILRASNNTFSQDFSGLAGPSQQGANVNITSGESTFQRKP